MQLIPTALLMLPSQNRSSFLTAELNETNNVCIISMCVYLMQCWVLTKLICDKEPALLQLLMFLKQGTDGEKGTCFSQTQKQWSSNAFTVALFLIGEKIIERRGEWH